MKISSLLKYNLDREKATFFLLSLLLTFPLLPISYSGFLGVFVSVLLIALNLKNKNNIASGLKPVILSVLFYFILIISLLYSQNISLGFKEIGKTLLLGVFPISIIKFSPFNKRRIDFLLKIFIVVNVLLCFYVFFIAIEILSFKKMIFLREANLLDQIKTFISTPYNVPFNWSSRNFKIYLFFHKAYISLSLCLSGIVALYILLNRKNNIFNKTLLIMATLLIAYFMYYMQSLPNLLSFLLGSIIVSFNFFKKKIKHFLILLTLVIGIIGFYFNGVITVYEKILFQVENDLRNDIWKCGWDVSKTNLLMGIGVGDQEYNLLECYENNSGDIYKKAFEYKLNSHNQYLSFMISGGLLCLIAFLYLLFNNLKIAVKNNDLLFLAFLVLITVNFLFENILDRVYGVFFFAFFNSFFIKRNIVLEGKEI